MDRGKEKSGVIAQTTNAIPPVFVTDARCSTTGSGVQGIRLENDCDVARRECGNRDHLHCANHRRENMQKATYCIRCEVQNRSSKVAEHGTQIGFNLVSDFVKRACYTRR